MYSFFIIGHPNEDGGYSDLTLPSGAGWDVQRWQDPVSELPTFVASKDFPTTADAEPEFSELAAHPSFVEASPATTLTMWPYIQKVARFRSPVRSESFLFTNGGQAGKIIATGLGTLASTVPAAVPSTNGPTTGETRTGPSGERADTDLARGTAWSAAPEMVLLDGLPDTPGKHALIEQLLRKRGGIRTNEEMLDTVHREREFARAETVRRENEIVAARRDAGQASVAMMTELTEHLRASRGLARLVPWFLGATTAFSLVMTALILASLARPLTVETGTTAALLVFVLAIVAISPAVLLLTSKPLGGLDSWTPNGILSKPEKPDGPTGDTATSDSGDSGGTKPAAA